MSYADIKNKSQKELHKLLAEKRNELRELRFKVAENQLAKVSEIKRVKVEIAHLMTAINTAGATETK